VYMHSIIANHAFSDGNKRTGLEAALLFLRLNGYRIKIHLDASVLNSNFGADRQKHLENFTLSVASGALSLEQVQAWFRANIEPRP